MSGDEIVRVEKFKIERFVALGLGRYEAIRAVQDGRDWPSAGSVRDDRKASVEP